MKKRNKLALTFLTFCGICFMTGCNKPHSALTSKNDLLKRNELSIDTFKTVYPAKATNKHPDWNGAQDTLSITTNNYRFTIFPGGLLKWGDKDSLLLSKDMYVAKAYFQLLDNDLILFCEMSDSDTGTSDIFRIDFTNKQMKWKANLNGFNLGKPAIRGNFGYITTIGCVGKLDLVTGKYVYVNSNLYDIKTEAFNDFDTILFKENKTYFVSKRPLENIVDTVIFDEITKKMTTKKQG